jgi:histidinol-phosphate aminotransferase
MFSGARAKEMGLIDELGDMEMALDMASEMGRVPRRVQYVRPRRPLLERLLALPLLLVLDEAYIEFASPGASRIREVSRRENLIVLRTFSKWAGLAGLRVGYGAFPESLMPHLWKIKQPYNVSVAAATAAIVSLKHTDRLEHIGQKIITERERLYAALQQIPWLQPYPSQANFILCRVRGRTGRKVAEGLARRGILVRGFSEPRLEGYVRISVGRPEQNDALLRALRKL